MAHLAELLADMTAVPTPDREREIEQLRETVKLQQARIEKLHAGLVLALSTMNNNPLIRTLDD